VHFRTARSSPSIVLVCLKKKTRNILIENYSQKHRIGFEQCRTIDEVFISNLPEAGRHSIKGQGANCAQQSGGLCRSSPKRMRFIHNVPIHSHS
ncbi:hypothetical protein, partial [Sutterella wadsworthensis]|uniref:hypothetical protein n=1 Tax=Sutterella wadsworthensis TaxID=40545 RepID=UPI0039679899